MKPSHYFLSLHVLLLFMTQPLAAQKAQDMSLIAPDGSTVTIDRDEFGVPHISAENEAGVFFGQGFAVAQDRLVQMERFRHAAEGRLTEWLGTTYLEMDKTTRTMLYTPEERRQQFEALPQEIKRMLEAYRDGINTYLDSMQTNPAEFKPFDFQIFAHQFEPWTVYNTVAIIQYFTRLFGQAGGDELDRLAELQENGMAWLDENRPINDPDAPTTIQASGSVAKREWSYSGIRVRPEVVQALQSRKVEILQKARELGISPTFGSFAVLISPSKSSTGNVMLLGAPQMGAPQENETNVTNEVELNCPTLHVGGMTIAGVPLVIIGHNDHQAWTLTSGVSDNSDVYIETTADNSFGQYLHNGAFLDFEVFEETIRTPTGQESFTHYRTVHGPVFAEDLENNQAFSLKMSFWNRELDMAVAFYNLVKTSSLEAFEATVRDVPFSFNLFYAGQDQQIKFWHIGVYQDRSDGVDPRLPHNGDGSEEWQGFIPFEELPQADLNDQDYFVNWNNKPAVFWNNGDNIPWAGNTRLTQRVLEIEDFVGPIQAFTYDNLKDVPRQIEDFGTYQQAIELTGNDFIDENIVPPGQSEFVNTQGQPSPHKTDQWELHQNWEFKDMVFRPSLAVSVEPDKQVPQTFGLHQNFPNPFNPATSITYELPAAGRVVLQVYNLRGQLLQTLVNAVQPAGLHTIEWNADSFGSGVYLFRIRAGNFVAVRKGVLLK